MSTIVYYEPIARPFGARQASHRAIDSTALDISSTGFHLRLCPSSTSPTSHQLTCNALTPWPILFPPRLTCSRPPRTSPISSQFLLPPLCSPPPPSLSTYAPT